jgi:tetratricopeptide (TPR) repeat protein
VVSLYSCKPSASAKNSNPEKTNGSQLADKDRVNFEYLFFNANKEKVLGNYELAETYYSQALRINPNSAATMYELANIYLFQNNKNQALFYSKKAATIDPNNLWYQMLYADCLKENKNIAEYSKVYEGLVKKNPTKVEFYYELANAYLFQGKTNDALKTYDKVEERTGVSEEVSLQKLKIYRSLKNYDKAIEEANKLIKAYPKEAKYFGMLGELYQDKGQPDKAFNAYNDLLKIDPNNAYVHLSIADYYRSKKENEKAFEEIKLAFKSKDLDIDTKVKILLSYYSITEVYAELKSDADELCKIIVDVHPDEAKAFSIYGDFLYRDKKNEEARTQFRKAIALDKEKYAIWNQLLVLDSELNDYEALQKDSKEAMELFPNQPIPYFFNGAANIQLKKYEEAVEAFTTGKEFVFGNDLLLAQFYANIGDAQNQLKNHAASDEAYEKALEIDPNSAYVLNNYSYYLSLRKTNLERAEALSKKCNQVEPNNSSYQDTYGWILYQMNKLEDAKLWIGKAIENGGKGNATLLEHYGDVMFKLGNTEEAMKYWLNAQKIGGASNLIDKKIADKKLYE